MKLTVTTPLTILVESDDIRHLRAEDETGAFGILDHHEDFLTALSISVVTWRDAAGAEHYLAVRGGMLSVQDGKSIAIATPEAVVGTDLKKLETEVLTRFRQTLAEEQVARADVRRLYLSALRQIYRLIRPDQHAGAP
jgi:F-type H+-transporting ATPase subunit epsilon